MTEMTVLLPDEMKAFIEAQVSRQGLSSPGEYFLALVREAQTRQFRHSLETKLREAIESGPALPMTHEDFETIEREGLRRLSLEETQS